MKTEAEWLAEYRQTHRHPLNRRLHHFCVPAIFWSLFALLWSLPMPFAPHKLINWGMVALFAASVFYWKLGRSALKKFSWLAFASIFLTHLLGLFGFPVWKMALVVFVMAWIGQFYGHKVEGAKPAFMTDLAFLLVGPLWIFSKEKS